MSDDPLRIDLALARAAGLPLRSSNDGSAAAAPALLTPASPDTLFSPLALLLARFLPSHGTPAPVPTPEEARLLEGYLQQRVVAALHAAGVMARAVTRASVDADGVLHVVPAPLPEERLAPLLRRDPDIARLVAILQRAAASVGTAQAGPLADGMAARPLGSPRIDRTPPDPRRAWPWRFGGDGGAPDAARASAIPPTAWIIGACAALSVAWWLLG